MINYSEALRTAAPSAEIERADFAELCSAIKAVNVRFVHHKESGNEYMQVVAPDDQYISIRVNTETLKNVPEKASDRAKWLMVNGVIYTGVKATTGRWFTFGPEPEFPDAVLVSVASLLKKATAGIKAGD